LRQKLLERFEAYSLTRSKQGAALLTSVVQLSGVDFEGVLFGLLRQAGAENVRGTPTTGDQGADVLFEVAGTRVAVQAKRYGGKVGNKAIQEAYAAKGFYGCDKAWVITNSQFTPSAKHLANELGVTLLDGTDLGDFETVFRRHFTNLPRPVADTPQATSAGPPSDATQARVLYDLLTTLVNLGYPTESAQAAAQAAIKKLGPTGPEALLGEALRSLANDSLMMFPLEPLTLPPFPRPEKQQR
jgi:hypothetical protein